MDGPGTPQLSLALSAHLGEDVALERRLAFEARTGFFKPFRGTAVGLEFHSGFDCHVRLLSSVVFFSLFRLFRSVFALWLPLLW